jgi:hypothetical protein
MSDDDFERADADAGGVVVETLPAKINPNGAVPANVVAYREQLVRQYHEGSPSLVERLRKAGKADYEMLVVALIDEVIKETDHLLGNELVATQNGELRDASIISFKRAEVLEKAISAVQAKHELEKDSGIDTESPAMAIIFKFFMSKAKESFGRMGMGDEINDLFFRTFSDITENWKRELRDRFDELRNQG